MNCKDVNVLVVDDSRVMRRIIVKCLDDMGFRKVYEAENGRAALTLLSENKSIDLILSDWSMPCLSGLNFLKEVRKQASIKDTPFVLLTAEAQMYTILMAFKANVSSYIIKPFTPDYFRYIIRRVLKENYADFCEN